MFTASSSQSTSKRRDQIAQRPQTTVMLSRVAGSLYWMSRNLERAENIARLLDVNFQLLLDFGSGRQASFVASTQSVGHQSLELIGTRGRVELVIPFNAPADTATALLVDPGYSPDGHLSRREIIPPCDQYTEQANAFCRAVLGEAPLPWGVEDAISNMRVLDAIFASEKSGGWAAV